MPKVGPANSCPSEVELPTDLLAGLLPHAASEPVPTTAKRDALPPKIYAVMAVTSLLTFATLATGYQWLVPHQVPFA